MREKVDLLLKENGAVLLRSRKHQVWRLANGKTFVRAQTPSDKHSDNNNLSDLKRALGIQSNGFNEGERREKKVKQPREEVPKYKKSVNSLADKLLVSGIAESALREQIEELRTEKTVLQQQNALLSDELTADCWVCHLRDEIAKWIAKTRKFLAKHGF